MNVADEFAARSPDEITLVKGDRVELIEKDDDFGDGWYLGKHLQSGNTGLFPEGARPTAVANKSILLISSVYTIIAPKITPAVASRPSQQQPPPQLSSNNNAAQDEPTSTTAVLPGPAGIPSQMPPSNDAYRSPQALIRGQRSSDQSALMNHMHNVIDSHITALGGPEQLMPGQDLRPTSAGAESHYSREYIPGAETDEEEDAATDGTLTMENVKQWSPEKVAGYLQSVGVEKSHCDLFQEEEFTGEVILEMEQPQVFMKELDLGPIGRRMKTWQKIKALQDEVKFGTYASPTTTALPGGMPISPQSAKGQRRVSAAYGAISSVSGQENRRPSAGSSREIGITSRHSSVDQVVTGSQPFTSQPDDKPTHGKQASFDRGWSMSHPTNSITNSSRPASTAYLSSSHTPFGSTNASSQISLATEIEKTDVDRGYVSGGESTSRRPRKVLKKRDASGDQHKRMSSYGSDGRRSSKGFFWQKNRESGDEAQSAIDANLKRTSQKDGVRIVSEPVQGSGSPTVTRLEYDNDMKPTNRQSAPYSNSRSTAIDQSSSTTADAKEKTASTRGARAVSEAVTGRERAIFAQPEQNVLPGDSTLMQSPTDIMNSPGSSLTGADANKSEFSAPPQGVATSGTKRKAKNQTSAYIRGLQKVGPQEQAIGADYRGWMKKKSSNLMTTWKPRYFVLKGRRLSYYYADSDTEEKGLIDISNHRVLPAGNDFFTGLHATLTGASGASPTSGPNTPNTPASVGTFSSIGSNPYGSMAPGANGASGDHQTFIFKLVPPRTGLSKGVNFTKPSIHYFAVSNRAEGRLWMAALMKSTIDRDEAKQVVTTYQQRTITLEQARARRELPPFLKGVEEEQALTGIQEDEDDSVKVLGGPGQDGESTSYGVDSISTTGKPPSSSAGASAKAGITALSPTTFVPGSYNSSGLQKVQREGPADLPQIVSGLEQNGVVQSTKGSTRTSRDQQGLGIQGLSSGVSNEPDSPLADRMKTVAMY